MRKAKFTLKALAAAVALGATANASAFTLPSTAGNGDMVLTAFDPVLGVSIVWAFGPKLGDFLPNALGGNKTPGSGLNLTFNVPNFSSLFGASAASNIRWNVTGADQLNSAANPDGVFELLAIATTSSATNPTVSNSSVGTGASKQNAFLTALNTVNGAGATVATASTAGEGDYAGNNANWGATWGGVTDIDAPTASGLGTTIGFWIFKQSSTAGLAASTKTRFGNEAGFATWSLGADGVLSYNVPAVPIPAAAWLFGSALVGLAAVGRRRETV